MLQGGGGVGAGQRGVGRSSLGNSTRWSRGEEGRRGGRERAGGCTLPYLVFESAI